MPLNTYDLPLDKSYISDIMFTNHGYTKPITDEEVQQINDLLASDSKPSTNEDQIHSDECETMEFILLRGEK